MFTDDKDIARELTAALDVAPSSDFEAGVLRRIEQDQPSRRLVAPAWLAAAAAVVLGVSAWILGAREEVSPEPVPVTHPVSTATARQPSGERRTLSPAPAVPEPRSGRRPGATNDPAVTATAAAEPEIIVPANQVELIRRFLRAVNTGRMDPSERITADPALEELIVPALIVPPIPIVTLEPGGGSIFGPKGLQQ